MTPSQNNNPGCLTAILQAIGIRPKDRIVEKLPYGVNESILSPAEISFYHVLHSVVFPKYQICLKIRLADILKVVSREKYMSYFNKISQRHIDFLLCHPETMKPILGIELDDSSHKRKDRGDRDEFVNRAFKSAGLPLQRISAKRSYNTKDLGERLLRYLPELANGKIEESPQKVENIEKETLISSPIIPTCPKCGSEMVLRTVQKGEHKGKQFYGCSTFPKCRGVLPTS